MNPRELVDHIRNGATELVLTTPLRFRRRTRSNPCDFDEFIQALQSSEMIRSVDCYPYLKLTISEDEWIRLVKTIGSIKDIQHLELDCVHGSRDFHPLQAVADAVKNAHSLLTLAVTVPQESPHLDQSGKVALANALRQHTALQKFSWYDVSPQEGHQDDCLDSVLRALPACSHLREVVVMTKCASSNAVKNLLHSPRFTNLSLVMNKEHWLAVADEIQHGRNNIGVLTLTMLEGISSEATEAVKAIASAIRRDDKLITLVLQTENGFTDEAGVDLAEALKVNTTLQLVVLRDTILSNHQAPNKGTLGVAAYEAFSAMLLVNTSLTLEVPPLVMAGGEDEMLLQHFDQMRIEQRLNKAGRGRLLTSGRTTRAAWLDALHELNAANADGTPAFQVGCLYSLLRLKPPAWVLELKALHGDQSP
jgi:hypothetical protein